MNHIPINMVPYVQGTHLSRNAHCPCCEGCNPWATVTALLRNGQAALRRWRQDNQKLGVHLSD